MDKHSTLRKRLTARKGRLRFGITLLGLSLLIGLFSCHELPWGPEHALAMPPSGDCPPIRVAIRRNETEVRLAVEGSWSLKSMDGQMIRSGRGLDATAAVAPDGTLLLAGNSLNATQVELVAQNGRVAVGGVDVAPVMGLRADEGKLSVIAFLPLEQYLCGVLLGEVPADRWHPETLKAQAVASRSYALFHMLRRKDRAWDVTATQSSQVFKPQGMKNPRVNRAVNSTRGLVLTEETAVIPAYFHSSCGGHTEANGNVFNERTLGALLGSRCGYCRTSNNKFASWDVGFGKDEICVALQKHCATSDRPRISGLRDLEIIERGVSGRALTLRVRHAFKPFDVPAERLRQWLGPMELPSTNFRIDVGRTSIRFIGHGWGHGVGMCQFGAEGMARSAFKYRDILERYYPNAHLQRAY